MRRMGSTGKTDTSENHFLKITKVHSPKNIVLYARSSLLPWTTNERFLMRMILKSKKIFRDLAAQSPQIHRKLQCLTANKSHVMGITMLWCFFFLNLKKHWQHRLFCNMPRGSMFLSVLTKKKKNFFSFFSPLSTPNTCINCFDPLERGLMVTC